MAAFKNQAMLNYRNHSTVSNMVTGNLENSLRMSKYVVNGHYWPGELLTYVVNIINAGTAAYTDLSFTDDLGAYNYQLTTLVPLRYVADSVQLYVDGVRLPDPTVVAGPPMAVNGLTLGPGSEMQLIYQAEVNQYAPLGWMQRGIVNTAAATGNGMNDTAQASATIYPDPAPRLTISKSLEPATVTVGHTLSYTFNIQNNGPMVADALQNIEVMDRFDPMLNNLTVTLDGQTLTEGVDYDYNTMTGLFTTRPGRITVRGAEYARDETTGAYTITPGAALLVVSGTV